MKKLIILLFILFGILSWTDYGPNLEALYEIDDMKLQRNNDSYIQPPVIIIPGLGGSTLTNKDGVTVWPGSVTSIAFSDYDDLALMINDETLHSKLSNLTPGSLISEVLGADIYGSLIYVLENYADFKHAKLGEKHTGTSRQYYLFPYDWRQNIYRTSKKLDELIDQIRVDYNDPNLEVDLIAHSQGGLVSRYYLKYGTSKIHEHGKSEVTQAGAKKVRKLIQLGTPNLGATVTLIHFIEGKKILSGQFSTISIATLPSIYELLPHPIVNWAVDIDGNPLNIDLYSPKTWEKFEWGIYNSKVKEQLNEESSSEEEAQKHLSTLKKYFTKHLGIAKKFHLKLSKPFTTPQYSIVAFGGNCQPTKARFLFEEINGKLVPRLNPEDIQNPKANINYQRIMLEPGDGIVTKPSLLARDYLNPAIPRIKNNFFPLDYAFFLCNSHRSLTGDINFQDNLLNELLER